MAQSGHIQAVGHLSQRRHRRQEFRATDALLLFVIVLSSILETLISFIFMIKIDFYQSLQVDQIDKTVDFFFHSFFTEGCVRHGGHSEMKVLSLFTEVH